MSRSPIQTSKMSPLAKGPMNIGGNKATNKKAITGVAKLTDKQATTETDGQVSGDTSTSGEAQTDFEFVTDDGGTWDPRKPISKDPKKAAYDTMKALYGIDLDYKKAVLDTERGINQDNLDTQKAIAQMQANSQNQGLGIGLASQIPNMVGAIASAFKGSGGGSSGGGTAQGTREGQEDKMHEMHDPKALAKLDKDGNPIARDKFGNRIETNPNQGQVSMDSNGRPVVHQLASHENNSAHDYDSTNGMSFDAHGSQMHSLQNTVDASERSDSDSQIFAQTEEHSEIEQQEQFDFELEGDYA